MTRYVDPTEQLVAELSVRDLNGARSPSIERSGSTCFGTKNALPSLPGGPSAVPATNERSAQAPCHRSRQFRVMVPDVDQIWQRVSDLAPRIIVPIDDRHYGLRDFTILDPDGFELRFATWLCAL